MNEWNTLKLSSHLTTRVVSDLSFSSPTRVQNAVIPLFLGNKDVCVKVSTELTSGWNRIRQNFSFSPSSARAYWMLWSWLNWSHYSRSFSITHFVDSQRPQTTGSSWTQSTRFDWRLLTSEGNWKFQDCSKNSHSLNCGTTLQRPQ